MVAQHLPLLLLPLLPQGHRPVPGVFSERGQRGGQRRRAPCARHHQRADGALPEHPPGHRWVGVLEGGWGRWRGWRADGGAGGRAGGGAGLEGCWRGAGGAGGAGGTLEGLEEGREGREGERGDWGERRGLLIGRSGEKGGWASDSYGPFSLTPSGTTVTSQAPVLSSPPTTAHHHPPPGSPLPTPHPWCPLMPPPSLPHLALPPPSRQGCHVFVP